MKSTQSQQIAEKKKKNRQSLFDIAQKPYIRAFLFLAIFFFIAFSAIGFAFPDSFVKDRSFLDFEAFYISGLIFHEGNLSNVYNYDYLFAFQKEFTGTSGLMTWTYPPHFNLLTGFLALFPIGLSYLIFIVPSVTAYLWVIRQLAGRHSTFVLLLLFPMVIVCIRAGQSSLFLAACAGLFVYLFTANIRQSWIPLVLLTFKPHLMFGIVAFLVVKKQWVILLSASLATGVLLLIITLMTGIEIWPAFLLAVDASSEFLKEGSYKLRRMFSYYAMFRSFDFSANTSLMIQLIGGLSWFAVALYAMYRKWCLRHVLAIVIFASIFLSPYAYDYDLLVFGVGVALLVSEIARNASNFEALFMIFLSYAGFIVSLLKVDIPSLGALVVTTLCVMCLVTARRSNDLTSSQIQNAVSENR